MKKLLIMFVIASMAVVSNAASINWVMEGGPTGGGYTAYLFYSHGAVSANSAAANQISMADLLFGIGEFDTPTHNINGLTFAKDESLATKNIDNAGEFTSLGILNDVFMNGDRPYLYMVIFYSQYEAAGKHGEGDYYYFIASTTVDRQINNDNAWAYNFEGKWGNIGASVLWDFQPVPEPATMALVGIGIVAFGLRRRRK